MKKLFSPLLLMLALIGLQLDTNAQVLGIDTITYNVFGLPDTITINDNYNHTVFVNNQTATPYTGTIFLMAAVDTGAGLVDIDTVGQTNVTGFTQNDTASISYNEIYSFPNKYKLGGNIVVVWPIAYTGTTVDTLFQPVWILNQTGVGELELQHGTKVFPNPVQDQIQLFSPHPNEVKQVRIYDLKGRVIKEGGFQNIIDMRSFASGMFILEITYANNQREHLKILKE